MTSPWRGGRLTAGMLFSDYFEEFVNVISAEAFSQASGTHDKRHKDCIVSNMSHFSHIEQISCVLDPLDEAFIGSPRQIYNQLFLLGGGHLSGT
jgi:hypothetical protein